MPNPRSLFDLEAERIAKLNAHKNKPTTSESFVRELCWKIGGISLGIGVGLVIMLLVLIPMSAYSVFAYGFVAMKLWAWFVAPTFGLPQISWVVGGGMMLLVRLFTHPTQTEENKTKKPFKEQAMLFLGILLIPWYSLFIGWLLHVLM